MPRSIASKPAAQPSAVEGPFTQRIGKVLRWCPDGRLLVDFPGNTQGPLPADVTADWDNDSINRAILSELPAILGFDGGDPAAPFVLGFLRRRGEVPPTSTELPPGVTIDGKTVTFEGKDKVTLRSGKAQLVLRSDGLITLNGQRISSSSRFTHRIKGGSVQIN